MDSNQEVYTNSNLIGLIHDQDYRNEIADSTLQSTDSEVERNEPDVGKKSKLQGGVSPEAWSTNSDSPTPTNSVTERPWARDILWQGLLGDEHRQLLGTEEESSDRHSSDEDIDTDLESIYRINAEQLEYYKKQFSFIQPDATGLVSGHIARIFFEKSRIPVEQLRHIWQLCDVTKDGALSLSEFAAAMHLVVLRRNNIPLPQVLPSCLDPSRLIQSTQSGVSVPQEADLLHLDDEAKGVVTTNEGSYKENFIHSNNTNILGLNTSSQLTDSASPTVEESHKNYSASNSPTTETVVSPSGKDLNKDWANQNRQWTKFPESPTSNVSSPGLKPVNFDMQRTAQAVVSDPQILHPVPLRVTPVATDPHEADVSGIHRKLETLFHDVPSNSANLKPTGLKTEISTASSHLPTTSNRDSLQVNDLCGIQRPQPKKMTTKNLGAIPPPPQRDLGPTNITEDPISLPPTIIKKEQPPLPPPRPYRHARSSSLDLNKLKMNSTEANGGAPQDISLTTQHTYGAHDTQNPEFADFAHFSNLLEKDVVDASQYEILNRHSMKPSRLMATSIQSSQHISAFEVYRKPMMQQLSETLPPIIQGQNCNSSATDINQSSSSMSNAACNKRIAAISEMLRQTSFNHGKDISDVLRNLKQHNVLLLHLCKNLSEELLVIQQRKEEIRNKINCFGSNSINENLTGMGASNERTVDAVRPNV